MAGNIAIAAQLFPLASTTFYFLNSSDEIQYTKHITKTSTINTTLQRWAINCCILLKSKAGFTLYDTLPSLLDRPRICQCTGGGARARVLLSCASFPPSTTAWAESDYRLSQPIGLLFFSAHSPTQTITFLFNFHSINLVQNQKSICYCQQIS